MPRTIPQSIHLAVSKATCPIAHLLTITVGSTTLRYSEDQLRYLGNIYSPGLRLRAPIRYSEQLRVDPFELDLQNISLEAASLLKMVGPDIQGQEATLERLYLTAGESLLMFRGRISEIALTELMVTLTLIADFDPVTTTIPTRRFSALCTWTFADSNCGYTSSDSPLDPQTALPFTTCPKDFLSCGNRGRQHRFPGFIHLTRDVSEISG